MSILRNIAYWMAYCSAFVLVMLILVWPVALLAIVLLGPSFNAMNP